MATWDEFNDIHIHLDNVLNDPDGTVALSPGIYNAMHDLLIYEERYEDIRKLERVKDKVKSISELPGLKELIDDMNETNKEI